MAESEANLPSPPAEATTIVPLDSAIRTTPIHPDLPEIQVPGEPKASYYYHPVTCQPMAEEDVHTELEKLRQDFPTRETALREQEQAAKEAKRIIEEADKKREQIQKEMDKKTKEREMELKVVSKLHIKASEVPS